MRLLIVGNSGGHIEHASRIAHAKGARVAHCSNIDAALDYLRNGKGADLVMIDVRLDVVMLIAALKAERISVPVVGCGLENDSASAVKAIKAGAREYIPLPPDEELIAAVLEAIAEESNDIIGQSEAMQRVVRLAGQIAPSEAGVLITGESGTGKEVIAKYIHKKSKRADKDMVSVNCAAIPDNLLESELFGHEKGAFTGAVARRVGKFEEANNSTLLLDEISEMDLRLQAKLLRAIQEKVIDRVGGTRPVPVNIRIIATSNRDLKQAVQEGTFREDLFFRLNVIHIDLPPLRQRKEDIPAFARYFAKKYATINAVSRRSLSPDAVQKLERYSWPGNVRELENVIHRAVLLAMGDVISDQDITLAPEPGNDNGDGESVTQGLVGKTVASVEKELILGTIDHCLGNRTHAATILGISIRTLRNKLNEYEAAEAKAKTG